jgi:Xaa-Pro aminopeptidase
MNYSPNNNIPSVSLVDAGTVELVRSLGVEVLSSADLVAAIHSTIDARGLALHQKAGTKIQAIKDEAFELIFRAVKKGKALSEYAVQQHIMKRFAEEKITSGSHGPIVAANAHAADPHFEPPQKGSSNFKRGDRILLDIWGKSDEPDGIYYDITWCGIAAEKPVPKYAELFALAVQARDAALEFVREGLAAGKTVRGYEVDQVCRGVIAKGGYERYFSHRTGHSIGTEVHGEGANIDSIETLDDREILPNTIFSIEPGIYVDSIGVRTEISVCVGAKQDVHVYGPIQSELITMK